MAVMPALVRPKVSLQEQLSVDSGALSLNAQESLVNSQQSIVTGLPLMTEEFIKPRSVQLETLAESSQNAKLDPSAALRVNDEPSIIPSSFFQETELQTAPAAAPTELRPSLSLSDLQTVLPTVLQFTESIGSLASDELQNVASSPDNLQLDDFDQLAMKDNASFQLSERNAYDIQQGDFEQNSLVNQITNQSLFISNNNETSVKLPFTESAALSKQSFTFNDDSGQSTQSVADEFDGQGVNNPIINTQDSINISLKAISESAALRAIAIIEESLSQELEGRLA